MYKIAILTCDMFSVLTLVATYDLIISLILLKSSKNGKYPDKSAKKINYYFWVKNQLTF